MTTDLRQHAIHRIRARQHFYTHLVLFLAMGVFFVALWARSGAPNFWPIWPMLGWGVGLAFHAMNVFGWARPISEEGIQREIARVS